MHFSRLAVYAGITALALGSSVGVASAGQQETGNGAPSGSHYTLNIIGVSKDKSAAMDGNNGSRIFVPLWANAKINLTEGDFGVLDANGTDKDGATFSLPSPDPDGDGVTEYSVYARALGTPGGASTTTTCATDPATGEEVCSTESMVLVRNAGKSRFDNVSRELLYVYYDLDGDGSAELIPLFDERLEDYFWDYDNKGLRVAQLRFYETSTDVN
ncbi:MAG TPA: hypothetical protein VLB29_05225 [Nocardioidaceae bacterium]|nr:hypothetical protein [Nocardioidaceae bacterium]